MEQRGALFWAVVGNNLEMVHILLDGGAYPDLADKVTRVVHLSIHFFKREGCMYVCVYMYGRMFACL